MKFTRREATAVHAVAFVLVLPWFVWPHIIRRSAIGANHCYSPETSGGPPTDGLRIIPGPRRAEHGDDDGTLWVRTTSPAGNAGPIDHVISREGKVIDRGQIPEGRLLAGFGKDGSG